jgi:hypothetical protein
LLKAAYAEVQGTRGSAPDRQLASSGKYVASAVTAMVGRSWFKCFVMLL